MLVSDNDSEATRARLKVMTKTNDGFKISEEDLKLRGPGDFFGSRQHGLPAMHVADLGSDMNVLQEAQDAARETLASDPDCRARSMLSSKPPSLGCLPSTQIRSIGKRPPGGGLFLLCS